MKTIRRTLQKRRRRLKTRDPRANSRLVFCMECWRWRRRRKGRRQRRRRWLEREVGRRREKRGGRRSKM